MRTVYQSYYAIGQQARLVWPTLGASDLKARAIGRGELVTVVGVVALTGGAERYQVKSADGRTCWCDPDDLDLPLTSLMEEAS